MTRPRHSVDVRLLSCFEAPAHHRWRLCITTWLGRPRYLRIPLSPKRKVR